MPAVMCQHLCILLGEWVLCFSSNLRVLRRAVCSTECLACVVTPDARCAPSACALLHCIHWCNGQRRRAACGAHHAVPVLHASTFAMLNAPATFVNARTGAREPWALPRAMSSARSRSRLCRPGAAWPGPLLRIAPLGLCLTACAMEPSPPRVLRLPFAACIALHLQCTPFTMSLAGCFLGLTALASQGRRQQHLPTWACFVPHTAPVAS